MSPAAELFNTTIPFADIALRMVIAALAGAAIGFERELNDRSAGLRTHMLIAVAAALFTIVTMELAYAAVALGESSQSDPLRIIEAVTAGVAFLGAGAIIRGRGDVRGLTTAAGMWLAGAIGVAAGGGLYGIVLLATALGVIIIVGVRKLEAGVFRTKTPHHVEKAAGQAGGGAVAETDAGKAG